MIKNFVILFLYNSQNGTKLIPSWVNMKNEE